MAKIEKIELNIGMNTGAPNPIIIANDYKFNLMYYLPDEYNNKNLIIKVVKFVFQNRRIIKFGSPNEVSLNGHRYYHLGLEAYGIFDVKESEWIEELKTTSQFHPRFNEDSYNNLKHYIFCFHDSTLECIAEGFSFEVVEGEIKDLLPSILVEFG